MRKRLLATLASMLWFCAGLPAFAQSISFTTNNMPLATSPRGITAADFNNDGKMDFAFADWGASRVLVYTNNGSGSFGSNASLTTVGTSPTFVATADINNDGKVDIITTDATDGRLVVFTNNGAGGYSQSFSNALGFGLFAVAVADINNDGRLDLITAGPKQVIFTNAGNGVFGSNATVTIPAQSVAVVAQDLNLDGKVDLVFADQSTSSLIILTNNGSGVFGSNATLHVSGNFYGDPNLFTAVDINADGKMDLICGSLNTATLTGLLTIFTNNGAGGFVLKTTVNLPSEYTASSLYALDMNNDGKPDVVTVGYNYAGPPSALVFTNNGTGNLTFCTSAPVDPNAYFTVADINNDGRPDLIVSDSYNSGLTTYIQNPTPQPATGYAQHQYTAGNNSIGLAAADINNDGQTDLITADSQGATLTVLTNNGSGIFGSNVTLNVGSQPFSVAAADINNDGRVDLISANFNGGSITIYTNHGGIFVSNTTINLPLAPSAHQPYSIVAADLNNDGKVDLVTANWAGGPGNIDVLYNNGSGGFAVNATLPADGAPESIIAADINNDGKLDLVCANAAASSLIIYTNRGNSFGSNTTIHVGSGPHCVIAADVNLDGKIDLITANFGASTLSVLTNNGSGGFALSATLNTGWDPYSVVAADINGDGKIDLISADHDGNSLTVYTNDGAGNFALYATIYLPLSYPGTILAADVNHDGKLDLLTANQFGTAGVNLQTIVPVPLLSIAPTGPNAVVVSWSSLSTSFTLQTNSDLGANWQSPGVSNSVVNSTNQSATFNTTTAPSLFFRLKQ